jgi:hypothetical protein
MDAWSTSSCSKVSPDLSLLGNPLQRAQINHGYLQNLCIDLCCSCRQCSLTACDGSPSELMLDASVIEGRNVLCSCIACKHMR